ncbi:hypothetical protein RRG08_060096, partial [Elysia crispata]
SAYLPPELIGVHSSIFKTSIGREPKGPDSGDRPRKPHVQGGTTEEPPGH